MEDVGLAKIARQVHFEVECKGRTKAQRRLLDRSAAQTKKKTSREAARGVGDRWWWVVVLGRYLVIGSSSDN